MDILISGIRKFLFEKYVKQKFEKAGYKNVNYRIIQKIEKCNELIKKGKHVDLMVFRRKFK